MDPGAAYSVVHKDLTVGDIFFFVVELQWRELSQFDFVSRFDLAVIRMIGEIDVPYIDLFVNMNVLYVWLQKYYI